MTRRGIQASFAERWTRVAAYACASLLVLYVLITLGRGTPRDSARSTINAANSNVEATDSALATTRTLELGAPTAFDISVGETQSFSLDLKEGQRIRLFIEKGDLALRASVCAPSGGACEEFERRRLGKLEVPLTAHAVGAYRVEISALETDEVRRPYSLRVEDDAQLPESHERAALAARAESEAERLRALWEESSLRESAGKYEEAASLWESAGEPPQAASAACAAGDVRNTLSEYSKALDLFKLAQRLGERAHDARAATGALIGLGYVYIYLGDNRNAMRYTKRVLDSIDTRGHVEGDTWPARTRARALNNLGEVYYSLGDLSKSVGLFEQALGLWAAAGGDRYGEALAQLNIGYSLTDLGELREAGEHYRRSLSLWQSASDWHGAALAQTALGGVRSFFGEKQAALDLHREAVVLFRKLGNRRGEAAALNGIASVFEDMSEYEAALDNYERALRLYEEIGNRDFAALDRLYVGRVYYLLGDTARALDYYGQTLALSREVGNREIEAHGLNGVGVVYDARGEKSKALEQFAHVLSLYSALGNRRGQAYALNNMGRVYSALGEREKALECFRRALPLIRAASDRRGEALILLSNAQAERASGDIEASLAHVKESTRLVESLRSQVVSSELRTSYFASVHKHYELYIDLLMSLDRERPGQGYAAEALLVSERARARSLMESLAKEHGAGQQTGDATLVARERELQQQLDAKAEYQARLLGGKHAEGQAREVARELRALTFDYQEVRARIREQSPRYAALTQPELVSVDSILQEVRDPDTLLLEYSLGEERSYLWAVGGDGVEGFELPARAAIEETARKTYEAMTARQTLGEQPSSRRDEAAREADAEYERRAAALSRMVLGPVAARLGGRRLLIVADGFLQYIPFEALPTPKGSGEPMLSSHEIVGLPSVLILTALRRENESPAPKTIAVLADPVFDKDDPRVSGRRASVGAREADATQADASQSEGDFYLSRAMKDVDGGAVIPRLPSTGREARAVRDLVPAGEALIATDFDASRERALSEEMGRYRIVHFATHAILDDEHPELSGIILSLVDERGAPRSGFLRLHDIYNLDLPSDLVVLSACRTGLGRNVPGEGLVGLTSGFMYAGAKSVVASLWQVDDKATSELMGHFYRALLKEGMTPASALRAAKREMLKREEYRAPYFWAAFVLQGEYRERFVGAQVDATRRSPLIVVAAAALLAFGVYLLLRARRRRLRG